MSLSLCLLLDLVILNFRPIQDCSVYATEFVTETDLIHRDRAVILKVVGYDSQTSEGSVFVAIFLCYQAAAPTYKGNVLIGMALNS